MHNVVDTEVVDNSNDIGNSNVGAIDIISSEISSADKIVNPNSKSVEEDSVVESMELDASGPSKKRSLSEDEPGVFCPGSLALFLTS